MNESLRELTQSQYAAVRTMKRSSAPTILSTNVKSTATAARETTVTAASIHPLPTPATMEKEKLQRTHSHEELDDVEIETGTDTSRDGFLLGDSERRNSRCSRRESRSRSRKRSDNRSRSHSSNDTLSREAHCETEQPLLVKFVNERKDEKDDEDSLFDDIRSEE